MGKKIDWKIELTESYVEMPAEHLPVYLEAQRILLEHVLAALQAANKKNDQFVFCGGESCKNQLNSV